MTECTTCTLRLDLCEHLAVVLLGRARGQGVAAPLLRVDSALHEELDARVELGICSLSRALMCARGLCPRGLC